MIITTTPQITGRQIEEYLGVVTGEEIVTGVANVFLGNTEKCKKLVATARATALKALEESARELDAGALVGVTVTYSPLAENVLLVTAAATAVTLRDNR